MTALYSSIGILVLCLQPVASLKQLFYNKGLPFNQQIKAAGSPVFVARAPISTPVIAAAASMLPYKLPNNDLESSSDCCATKGKKSSTKSSKKIQTERADSSSQ